MGLITKTKRNFPNIAGIYKKRILKRYENKKGLIQKTWYSNEETSQFGGIYIWETKEAMEEEIRIMNRVKSITGVDPTITKLNIEAIQEGNHNIGKLTERDKDTRSQKFGGSSPGWLVVYAVYERYKLVVLVTKFKHFIKKKRFNLKEQIELAAMKKKLDDSIERYFKRHSDKQI